MLQIFFGTDTSAVRAAAFAAVADTEVAAPDILLGESYVSGQLADAVGGVSLFGAARAVVIDTPTSEMVDELVPLLPSMAGSSDTFIIIEGPLLAAAKKRYQKHTPHLTEYVATKAERFNTFALAEALAQRQKKQAWVLLQQALMAGIAPEEIIGVLWWQLKSMRLAAVTNTAAEAGMKDFPYRKAKQALNVWSVNDVVRVSHSLLQIYHEGHGGEIDLTLALEQWTLTW